jgi:exo-beta-1,3-glucanase (GH17 family)
VARVTLLGACLALAACGRSQNWDGGAAFVTIGGAVSGLNGSLVLQNNGKDDLAIAANGSFTFALSIARDSAYNVKISRQPVGQVCTVSAPTGTASAAITSVAVACANNVTIGGTITGLQGTVVLQNNSGNPLATDTDGPFTFTAAIAGGSAYAVTVRTQPVGQTCSVTKGSGTATANVSDVAIECAGFRLRPLPDIYTDPLTKAINYSAYRAGGPDVGEIPSDANVLEDLGLLHDAGFNLLRLFGADPVAEKILRIARDNFPEMKFQQGIFLRGPTPEDCSDVVNSAQIATAVQLARQYPNVATVSVGNETSFAGNQRITCLASYVQTTRTQVAQPVTADDDYTFYKGGSAAFKPDTILASIDFVSIHTYPFLHNDRWNWQQAGTAPGPGRATAMMNAALADAQSDFAEVSNYLYRNAAGATVTVGSSLPIVIGETGWKAMQSNQARPIETFTAKPVNAKWYYDLMVSWEGTAGGPLRVFLFEATDETWKGLDDGWGLWDKDRLPRYALCGTPVGAPCNADLYQGAGFFPF